MEEQNSANAEESATPTNEPAALTGEADSAEPTKNNGRTLKLKGSEESICSKRQSAAMDGMTRTAHPATDTPANEKPASSEEPISEAKSPEPRGNTEEDAPSGAFASRAAAAAEARPQYAQRQPHEPDRP